MTKAGDGPWIVQGYDAFSGEYYELPGQEHSTEAAARHAAQVRLDELEKIQPSASSGGQKGIQDGVFIIRPDGTSYRFFGSQAKAELVTQ